MADYTQQRLDEVHRRLPQGLSIRTEVQTPNGVQIMIRWDHLHPSGTRVRCEVFDTTLDLSLRRVLLLEDDLVEAEQHGGGR